MPGQLQIESAVPQLASSVVDAPSPASPSGGRWFVLEFLPRLPVAAIFFIAGWGKFFPDTEKTLTFIREIRAYELVPDSISNIMAMTLPWIEMVTAVLLVIGLWGREMRWLIGGILTVFTVAKFIALLNELPIDCGCVPKGSPLAPLFEGWGGLLTNLVMIALLVLTAWEAGRRTRQLPNRLAPA